MPLDGTLYHNDEILQILDAAQERIRDPKNWCQGSLNEIGPDGAEQWCARGAIRGVWYQGADALLSRAAVEMGYGDWHGPLHAVVALNNSSDHPTVMAMFDRAREIHMAKTKETVHA